ncbi:hypothetical protein TC41_0214 [Alicyclobacillus acidocaldarius subsp. acidocaldarius Tc-4-1]|uniref:Uncharacterized protein n=1 Tax=Alicyclobacillus acidocaldarius (strain Tc-4-1) TaxID=1048834 RepID=F8IJ39_ALIAT|nr:hypothetical protein TC41_0214 [Alicyclobacillus acidocaldarius subsp. acidocaldarius Tc-4-1]
MFDGIEAFVDSIQPVLNAIEASVDGVQPLGHHIQSITERVDLTVHRVEFGQDQLGLVFHRIRSFESVASRTGLSEISRRKVYHSFLYKENQDTSTIIL